MAYWSFLFAGWFPGFPEDVIARFIRRGDQWQVSETDGILTEC